MRKALVVAALLVLAGCSALPSPDHPFGEDPDSDQLGWENGYWYDEDVSVTTGDGLNASEREAVVARTMARVEQIRETEFESNVSVEVISRAEYRNRSDGSAEEENLTGHGNWNDQVWEAIMLIGEDSSTDDEFGETLNSSVQGYYATGTGNITIVSESATPTVDRATLSHELVHALQDQQGHLNDSAETQDRQLADQSVTEGEANYIQILYEQRCGGRWSCLPRPDQGGNGSGGSPEDGVFLVMYQPYATGPTFVHEQRDAGGWDAVDDLYEGPPNSTEQVIHPEKFPGESPVNVTVPDRSNGEWSRFDHDPVADTVGEASIYAMLYHHDAANASGEWHRYESPPSAGWAGDAVVPYHNGSDGYGYVWRTRWDTERDAREFADAYRSILDERASQRPTENVYVLPESDPYGDAFRVVRDGKRVTVVNAPTRDALSGVHR